MEERYLTYDKIVGEIATQLIVSSEKSKNIVLIDYDAGDPCSDLVVAIVENVVVPCCPGRKLRVNLGFIDWWKFNRKHANVKAKRYTKISEDEIPVSCVELCGQIVKKFDESINIIEDIYNEYYRKEN